MIYINIAMGDWSKLAKKKCAIEVRCFFDQLRRSSIYFYIVSFRVRPLAFYFHWLLKLPLLPINESISTILDILFVQSTNFENTFPSNNQPIHISCNNYIPSILALIRIPCFPRTLFRILPATNQKEEIDLHLFVTGVHANVEYPAITGSPCVCLVSFSLGAYASLAREHLLYRLGHWFCFPRWVCSNNTGLISWGSGGCARQTWLNHYFTPQCCFLVYTKLLSSVSLEQAF